MRKIRIICKGNTLNDVKVVDAETGEAIEDISNINIDIDAFDGVEANITFVNPLMDLHNVLEDNEDDEELPSE